MSQRDNKKSLNSAVLSLPRDRARDRKVRVCSEISLKIRKQSVCTVSCLLFLNGMCLDLVTSLFTSVFLQAIWS